MSNRNLTYAVQALNRCLAALDGVGAQVGFVSWSSSQDKFLVMLDAPGALPAELDRLRQTYALQEGHIHLPVFCGCLVCWETAEPPPPANVFHLPRSETAMREQFDNESA